MNKRSTFSKARHREPQTVELRYKPKKEWTWEGERTRNFASVAIDGYCTRKRAERMFVREKRTETVNLGGTAVKCYRPEIRIFPYFGFFITILYKD